MRYAWDALRRRPRRSILTSLGIGLAVGLVVMLLALSNGITASATELATESGVDLIGAAAPISPSSTAFPPIPSAHSLASRVPAVDPNVMTASPWLIASLVFGNASLQEAAVNGTVPSGWSPTGSGMVGWIPSENGGLQTPTLYNGTGFTVAGDPHFSNGTYAGPSTHEIVLDQGLAGVLHVTVGDPVWVSPTTPNGSAELPAWYANATEYVVAGISGPFWLIPSALLAFTYLSELQSLLGPFYTSQDYASLLLVHLKDPTTVATDQSKIASAFPSLSWITLSEVLGAIQHVVNLYRTFGTLIGLIGIVIAALFTTTVHQMSVDDRSRELALLRAIGHTRASVGRAIVEESVLLAAIGFAIGLPVAYLGANAINLVLLRLLAGLPTAFSFVSFDATVILDGILLVLAVGLAAAIAPAARAMQLPVAEELRAP